MGWRRRVIDTAHRSGVFDAAARAYGRRRLTVLAYHRIVDPAAPGFLGFPGNVSATPEELDAQMAWAADRFTPVALTDAVAAAAGGPLPERPLLVTFDDGYRDNLTAAAPILERHGVPAVLFATTGFVDGQAPWWDLAAEWFRGAPVRAADLPVLGPREWTDPHRTAVAWIRAAKHLDDDQLRRSLERLRAILEVSTDPDTAGLMVSWDELSALSAAGWAVGGHTRSHPILTRIPIDRAIGEIEDSRRRLAAATGAPPEAFAYPNGQAGDFDAAVRTAVSRAGFRLGFTLVPGPSRTREVVGDPLAIRRVYVHRGDGVTRLAAKIGMARLIGIPR